MSDQEVAERKPASLEEIPETVYKSAFEAFGEFVEKVASIGDVSKGMVGEKAPRPVSWFYDPFMAYDSQGQNYRYSTNTLTNETIRLAAERNVIVAACVGKRVSQVSTFCRRQRNKYSVGCELRPRGEAGQRPLTPQARRDIAFLTDFLMNTGLDSDSERDLFLNFMKKLVRDSLTLDAGTFEKVWTYGETLHSFLAVDAASIYMAMPKNPKGAPPDEYAARKEIRYVQVHNGQNKNDYTAKKLAYLIRNPRTNLRVGGYGLPEIEVLQAVITSILWAEQYNQRQFSQGSTIRGILNLKGKIPPNQLELIRKQWLAQMSGVNNAWKTPLVNSDGVDFIPLQMTNAEMGFQAWLEYNIKCTCSLYNMDPSEIGFDLRGGIQQQQPMFMSNNEAQQKVSRDQGLQPLLHFFEDAINRHIVWPLDNRYEFAFVGIDAKTEEQAYQLRMQQVQNVMTLNEVRALEGLPPIPGGDIVLNPVYMGMMQQRQNAQIQQQQIAAQATVDGAPAPQHHEDLAFQEQPGEAENAGKQRLLEAANQGGEAEAVPEDEKEHLRHDDWTSSVHSSLKPSNGDLRKSVFEELEDICGDLE